MYSRKDSEKLNADGKKEGRKTVAAKFNYSTIQPTADPSQTKSSASK